jgi:hypothetical protein
VTGGIVKCDIDLSLFLSTLLGFALFAVLYMNDLWCAS